MRNRVTIAALLLGIASLAACGSDLPTVSIDDASTGNDATTVDAAGDSATDSGTIILPDGGLDASHDGSPVDGSPTDASSDCDSSTQIVCGGACVDPSDVAHCGSCTTTCPAVQNGTATCSASGDGGAYACGFSCGTGYHPCSGQCLPDSDDPSVDACVVSETYGVFVSTATGSDTASCGTRAAPCATVGTGIAAAHAANKRTYVCDDGTYNEQISLTSAVDGAKVYGGFSCTGGTWTYDTTKKPLVMLAAPTGAAACPSCALIATSLTVGATFEDFAFQAPNGVNPGDSSIAVFANSSTGTLTLTRSTITAGNGVGWGTTTGGTGSNYTSTMMTAPAGGAPSGTSGAVAIPAVCTNGSSAGGSGGNGVATVPPTDNGTNGTWTPAGTTSMGIDGLGGNGGTTNCTSFSDPGANGAGGTAGSAPTSVGTLDANGWHPTGGGAGGVGYPGQGGGGGGGKTQAGFAIGGGGGGAGGCGGGSGGGGSGGGSSIAVLSFASAVTLSTCTLSTGNGGTGEAGGPGGQGQGGGAYATGTFCTGNYGGSGGGGGGGAGGAGGVSVGILYKTTAPTTSGVTFTLGSFGAAGEAGAAGPAGTNTVFAGNPGSAGNAGLPGVSEQTLALP